ncbi:ABC transporter permease [Spirochaetota bacterium]
MRRYSENIIEEIASTYKFRFVVINFVITSLKQRYKKSVLGFAWVILTPMLQYLIIGLVFSYTFKVKIPNYFVYMFSGSVIFNMISGVINNSPEVMFENEHYIKKIYIPKLVYILNIVFREMVNFILGAIALLILAIIFQKITFSVHYFFLFIPVILCIFFLIGVSIILSVTAVYLQDLKEIIPVVMNAAYFMTPILYPLDMLPKIAHKLVLLNPFYYFVHMFRTPILKNTLPGYEFILVSIVMSFGFFMLGLLMLKKFDNKIVFKL